MTTGLAVTVEAPSAAQPFGGVSIGPLVVTGTIVPVVLGPTIASGVNTIAVPAGASGFVLTPPSTNTNSITLKGVSGDTGLPLPKATFSVFMFDTSAVPADIVLTAGGTVGLSQLVFF